MLLRVAQLVTDHADQIDQLDLNPLVVSPKGAKVVDSGWGRKGSAGWDVGE
jgi:hypothetical protein